MLSENDIEDLKRICSSSIDSPAHYKGDFHWNVNGVRAANILQRHNIGVHLDPYLGKVSYADRA